MPFFGTLLTYTRKNISPKNSKNIHKNSKLTMSQYLCVCIHLQGLLKSYLAWKCIFFVAKITNFRVSIKFLLNLKVQIFARWTIFSREEQIPVSASILQESLASKTPRKEIRSFRQKFLQDGRTTIREVGGIMAGSIKSPFNDLQDDRYITGK